MGTKPQAENRAGSSGGFRGGAPDPGGPTPRSDVLTLGTCLVELTPGDAGITLETARSLTLFASGAATLFACALTRLETSAAILSAVGQDDMGDMVVHELDRMGVSTALIQRVAHQRTTLSLAFADGAGGKTFWFYRFPGFSDPLETISPSVISDEALRQFRLFDFTESSIRQGGMLRETAFDLAERSRSLGLKVCYAPNWRRELWPGTAENAREVQRDAVRRCDILLLNQDEALLISGETDAERALQSLGDLGPAVVAITRGGEQPAIIGMRGSSDQPAVVPFMKVAVHYDVGAGDTFHAGFVSEFLRTEDPVQSGWFASTAAAIKITRRAGLDTLPLRHEVETMLKNRLAPSAR